MVEVHRLLLSIGYVELFLGGLSLHRLFRRSSEPDQQHKYVKTKEQILIMMIILTLLSIRTYFVNCLPNDISAMECFYIQPNEGSINTIGLAVFINTTLFLGGFHQGFYNGKMKRKFLKFYKAQFQWDLFNKLFVTPVCLEWIFRGLLAREVDPYFEHTALFTLFSGLLYSLCHVQNYPRFAQKYGQRKARNAVIIQCAYNLLFGIYCSYIFIRRKAIVATMIVHGYANFMGYPQYFQIFQQNYEDQRVRKTTLFYLIGLIGCMISCLFII